MIDEHGLRARALVWSALGAFVLSYVLLRLVRGNGGGVPDNSWLTLALLGLMTVPPLSGGWRIRGYLRGDTPEPPSPQAARLVLVAARACAVAGAVASGWYVAHALIRLPNADVDSQRAGLVLAAVLALASVGAAIGGMIAQSWCRIPPEDDDRSRDGGAATA